MHRAIPVVLVLLLVPTLARANSDTEADRLFARGRDLFAAGQIADACAAFDASQKLSPVVATLFNQAHCRERNQQFATAYRLFLEGERLTRGATDDQSRQLHQVATTRIARLESQISRLTVSSATPGIEVRINGELTSTFGQPIPVDGGAYTISARAPGHSDWSTTLTIAPSQDAKTVDVPPLHPLATHLPMSRPSRKASVRVPAVSAVVLLAGALGAELFSRSHHDKSKLEIDDVRRDALERKSKQERYFALGLGALGSGAIGLAIYRSATNSRAGEPKPLARVRSFDVEPAVTSTHAGFQLTRSFR